MSKRTLTMQPGVSPLPPAKAVAGRDSAFWNMLLEERAESKRVVVGRKRMNPMSIENLSGIMNGMSRGEGRRVVKWSTRHAHELAPFDIGFIGAYAIALYPKDDTATFSRAVKAIVENSSFSLVYKRYEKKMPDGPEGRRIVASFVSHCVNEPGVYRGELTQNIWKIECNCKKVLVLEDHSDGWLKLNILEARGFSSAFRDGFLKRMDGSFKMGVIEEKNALVLAAGTIEAMAAGAVIGALSAPAIAGAGAYALVGAFAGFALSLVSLFTIPTTIHGIMKAGAALVKSALAARRESRARNVLEGLENA